MEALTLRGPIALIKVNGVTIGKMKDIRLNETFQRGDVRGLGRINSEEAPVLGWNGTLTCSFYHITMTDSGLPGAVNRAFNSLQEFVNNITLDEKGFQVIIYKKIKVGSAIDLQLVAAVNNVLIESEGFDLTEGAISGKNQSFRYLDPVLTPI